MDDGEQGPAHECMYRERYGAIQRILDDYLGTEESDGAGEGIAEDVRHALSIAERRGGEIALRRVDENVAAGLRGLHGLDCWDDDHAMCGDIVAAVLRGVLLTEPAP